MKRYVLILLSFSAVLFAVNNFYSKDSQDVSINYENKQQFIILDSVDDEVFEKADINYMNEDGKPAAIPNFDLHQPVVITKMPLIEKDKETSNEDPIN